MQGKNIRRKGCAKVKYIEQSVVVCESHTIILPVLKCF
jgi:hypothetical protein